MSLSTCVTCGKLYPEFSDRPADECCACVLTRQVEGIKSDLEEIKAIAGRARRTSKAEHIARMALGWLLYWLVMKLLPAKWWYTPRGWFHWSVPHFGYYAHHPHDLAWWQPFDGGV